jgi:hypothetical protein
MNIKVAIPLFISFSQFELTDKYQPGEELVTSGIREAGLLSSR